MRLYVILFVLGCICIVSGITKSLHSDCNENPRVKILPRTVYDSMLKNAIVNVTPNNIYNDLLESY